MYTIADLEFAITRLRELREFIKDKKYDHSSFHCCGTPACALGWASELYPTEIQLLGFGDIKSKNYESEYCGIDLFNISKPMSEYLFGYFYYYAKKDSDSDNIIKYYRHRHDDSKETTIQRINKVEEYLRRKLASLLAEEECRTIHHKVVELV